jgi:hypothetical protein
LLLLHLDLYFRHRRLLARIRDGIQVKRLEGALLVEPALSGHELQKEHQELLHAVLHFIKEHPLHIYVDEGEELHQKWIDLTFPFDNLLAF